jgi:hypothetical protein
MSWKSRILWRGGRNIVIIENEDIPVLVIPLDDFAKLGAVRYVAELAIERGTPSPDASAA